MPNRLDFQELAFQKIKEAIILLRNKCFHGAFYIAGYVLEYSLKSAVCKNLDIDEFYEDNHPAKLKGRALDGFKTHDYNNLIILSGLFNKFQEDKRSDENLALSWSHIESMRWCEACRYDSLNFLKYNEEDVKQFIFSLDNKKGGFLEWIQQYW